jgi:pyrroloquinoline quinone (PQQ) biosynthesis protein C/quercetin dioxygenase-like cupin family protein
MSQPARTAVEASVAELRRKQSEHPFWRNRLLRAFSAGWLTIDDIRFVFSQYSLYSRNFTRFVAGVMANCENDLFRAQLSENLWEEGGGAAPEKRHAELFRTFLREGLGVGDPNQIEFRDFTRHYVREYLVSCLRASPVEGSAFLSLGTEGIVARMYEVFVEGLHHAGIEDRHLEFFYLHMQCDDHHAQTLEDMMVSYSDERGWYETCLHQMNHALDLRMSFFESIFDAIQQRRVQTILERIQDRTSLVGEPSAPHSMTAESGEALYANEIERLNVKFSVTRLPCAAEVLDPRVVRIAPGKFNEKHKHAHETLFYVIEGRGRVLVDEVPVAVKAGDCVFVPRWALHQSQNEGEGELVLLAVTDFGLTGKAFMGNYDKTARLRSSTSIKGS